MEVVDFTLGKTLSKFCTYDAPNHKFNFNVDSLRPDTNTLCAADSTGKKKNKTQNYIYFCTFVALKKRKC